MSIAYKKNQGVGNSKISASNISDHIPKHQRWAEFKHTTEHPLYYKHLKVEVIKTAYSKIILKF